MAEHRNREKQISTDDDDDDERLSFRLTKSMKSYCSSVDKFRFYEISAFSGCAQISLGKALVYLLLH